jgi:UDP-galactopyranose mutase
LAIEADFLIIGSGLTGATLARCLSDEGFSVLVLERRNHIGGNVHDARHASGIVIHTYGPHFFRTSSDRIWRFVNRFAEFRPFAGQVKSMVDGRLEDWPVTAEYLLRTIGREWAPEFNGVPSNFEEAALAQMPQQVYDKFVRSYTEKQWGVPARLLSAELAGRFEIRHGDDRRLKTSRYQGLPVDGYTAFMASLLSGIRVLTHVDYHRGSNDFVGRLLTVFTGSIDEYFEYDLGRLAYRAQRREHFWYEGVKRHQPVVSVNFPSSDAGTFVREIEWKHMMPTEEAEAINGTLVTQEHPFTPSDPDEFEYPLPDAFNRQLHERYVSRARRIPEVLFSGRLGDYRYYDMDQAIGRALALLDKSVIKRLRDEGRSRRDNCATRIG